MTAAVDSTSLFDVLQPKSPHQKRSQAALDKARKEGPIAISEPVYAEIASVLTTRADIDAFLRDLGIRVVPSSTAVLHHAGLVWRQYTQRRPTELRCSACGNLSAPSCPACGDQLRSRQHIIADFIVGAHAVANADRLITRDGGYYKTYFPALKLA